jgi:hypothetical protein
MYPQVASNGWFAATTLQDLVDNGLLTEQEAKILPAAQNTMHDVAISWISEEMFAGVQKGVLAENLRCSMPTELRGWVGTLQGQLLINQPNLWAALMRLVCDLLIVMFVLGNPLTNFMYEIGPFQAYVFLFTVFQTVPYLCVHMLVRTLENPYQSNHDMFNTDSLIAWSERACFHYLRCKMSCRFPSQVFQSY